MSASWDSSLLESVREQDFPICHISMDYTETKKVHLCSTKALFSTWEIDFQGNHDILYTTIIKKPVKPINFHVESIQDKTGST